tara:strand:- start:877 stop:1029 length:153 start_codon:yes stop_codon:yes gene_type:complete
LVADEEGAADVDGENVREEADVCFVEAIAVAGDDSLTLGEVLKPTTSLIA